MILWLLACMSKNAALSGLEPQKLDSVLGTHVRRAEDLWQQSASAALTLQDALKFLQQLQRVLDIADGVEALVDEGLQGSLQVSDLNIELHIVAVKPVVIVVQ